MIGITQRDRVVVARVQPGHQQREIVGLGTGVEEVTNLQVAGHFRGEFLRKLSNPRLEINGGRMLDGFVLLLGRREHVRMAMTDADRHDTAEAVEITLSRFVPHVLHLPLHDHEGFLVVEEEPGIEVLLPEGENLFGGRTGIRHRLVGRGRKRDRFHENCDG